MITRRQTKIPDLRLKEDPYSVDRHRFVLRFKNDRDMEEVISRLRENDAYSQIVINGEALTFVDKDVIAKLKRLKDLESKYEVW